MTADETAALANIRDSLRHLADVAKGAEQPTRGILATQIFLLVQKVRALMGEVDE